MRRHRRQLPEWFPADQAEEIFQATYPFHPTVLSVFERKWQSLPRFQRTRGILRLLALWVSRAWQRAYQEGSKEPLITLGSAPLGDSFFRAAAFEQLGEAHLEAAVLSDIAGEEAHAVRLDQEAGGSVKRLRLHEQVAVTVFFESSGGQVRNEATLPEVRLAVGGPEVEIGWIEDALGSLVGRCYYLDARGTAYWISHRPTLNKLLSDRRAALSGPEAEEQIREKVRQTIREVFKVGGAGLERRYFPEDPAEVSDVPLLRLLVMAPEHSWENAEREQTKNLVQRMIQEYGGRERTYKSGLIFVVAEGGVLLANEARTLLALESLEDPVEQGAAEAGAGAGEGDPREEAPQRAETSGAGLERLPPGAPSGKGQRVTGGVSGAVPSQHGRVTGGFHFNTSQTGRHRGGNREPGLLRPPLATSPPGKVEYPSSSGGVLCFPALPPFAQPRCPAEDHRPGCAGGEIRLHGAIGGKHKVYLSRSRLYGRPGGVLRRGLVSATGRFTVTDSGTI